MQDPETSCTRCDVVWCEHGIWWHNSITLSLGQMWAKPEGSAWSDVQKKGRSIQSTEMENRYLNSFTTAIHVLMFISNILKKIYSGRSHALWKVVSCEAVNEKICSCCFSFLITVRQAYKCGSMWLCKSSFVHKLHAYQACRLHWHLK